MALFCFVWCKGLCEARLQVKVHQRMCSLRQVLWGPLPCYSLGVCCSQRNRYVACTILWAGLLLTACVYPECSLLLCFKVWP